VNALLLFVALSPTQWPASASFEKAWYSPHEFLPALARRDGIHWVMPETLSGRAWVGGDTPRMAMLDDACKQWGLNWTEANGIIVVHREHPSLKEWTSALAKGETVAAWVLGWSRDARAISPLADALANTDPAVALAAAQALELRRADQHADGPQDRKWPGQPVGRHHGFRSGTQRLRAVQLQ
jgi:hypothetical protein